MLLTDGADNMGASDFAPDMPPGTGRDDVSRLRLPPRSEEAEQSLLGALLIDGSALARVSDLVTADSFYAHGHRLVFDAIASLSAEQAAVDVVTVFLHLKAAGNADAAGGLPYLNSVAQCVPSAANARQYAEIVADRALLRSVIAACDDGATAAFNPQGRTAGQVLDSLSERFRRVEEQRKTPAAKRVPLLPLQDLRAASAAVRWLVKHVVPSDSIGMMFGGSGTFKSFIALDAALHVCHGLPWMGRKTAAGAVIYIAAEGGAGLWPRIEAWHRARGLDWRQAPLYIVPAALDLGADAWRVVDAAQLLGVSPAMVIVDTLSQTYAGEENSANEVAAYLRELGARFRQLWGCAVLVIHHSGHNATERPRGSSVIRANTDFLLGVFRDEKEMMATVCAIKQKDGELFEDATFSLSAHEIGHDDDGDRITSLVARHLSSAEDIEQATAAEVRAGRGGKNQLLLGLLQSGMRESTLRKAFYEDCEMDNLEARKKAYQRAKAWATKSGFMEVAEGLVITLKAKK